MTRLGSVSRASLRNAREETQQYCDTAHGHLDYLGVTARISPQTKAAWRRYNWAVFPRVPFWVTRFAIPYLLATWLVHGIATNGDPEIARRNAEALDGLRRLDDAWNWMIHLDSLGFAAATLGAMIIGTLLLLVIPATVISLSRAITDTRSRRRTFRKGHIVARYQLIESILVAIRRLEKFKRATLPNRPHAMYELSLSLRGVYRELNKLNTQHGALPFRSHRRRLLSEHHGRVISALRATEAKLDSDPDNGARELAKMLLEVANQYAINKTGNLLPSVDLDTYPAARNWEPLKTVAVAAVVCAATAAAVILKVPATALTPLVGLAGVLAAALIYGGRSRSALDILDTVRGIQRP